MTHPHQHKPQQPDPDPFKPGSNGSAEPSRQMPKDARTKGSVDQLPASARDTKAPLSAPGLALPHERDESPDTPPATPDPVMVQAKRDIDAGLVDTDMRATPGQNAALRERMVPGPGGKPPH